MVAIVVDSRQDGETAWVATRGLGRIKVEGMSGCRVEVLCLPEDLLEVEGNGEYDLPGEPEFVKVRHTETNVGCRVFVDLVR